MIGEMDRVDGVDVEPEELEREGRSLVADVPADDVALDRQHVTVRRHDKPKL